MLVRTLLVTTKKITVFLGLFDTKVQKVDSFRRCFTDLLADSNASMTALNNIDI